MAARGAVACALAVCAVAAGSVTLPCKRPLVYGDDDSEDDTEAAVLYSVLQNAAEVATAQVRAAGGAPRRNGDGPTLRSATGSPVASKYLRHAFM